MSEDLDALLVVIGNTMSPTTSLRPKIEPVIHELREARERIAELEQQLDTATRRYKSDEVILKDITDVVCKQGEHAIEVAEIGRRFKSIEQQLAQAQKDTERLDYMQSLMKTATIRLEGEAIPRYCNAWSITAAGTDLRETIDETRSQLGTGG